RAGRQQDRAGELGTSPRRADYGKSGATALPKREPLMGLFKRTLKEPTAACPLPTDIETVRAKLAAVETEISAAETRLRSASLAAALNDDAAGFEALSQLQALRTRRELLTAAHAEAERIEADRL